MTRILRRPQALLLSGALALTLSLTACGDSKPAADGAGSGDSKDNAEVQKFDGTEITASDGSMSFYIP